MIDRQQLVAALERLDAREREVLDLSLRRRVPDDALADVYGLDPNEVAARRTAAIERLSQDMGIQRGADLGHMLQALLEPETWQDVTLPEPEDSADVVAESGEDVVETGEEADNVAPLRVEADAEEPFAAPDAGAEEAEAGERVVGLPPEAEAGLPPEAEVGLPPEAEDDEPEPAPPEPEVVGTEPAPEPVLEMLGEPSPPEQRRAAGKRRRATAAVAAVAAVLVPVGGIVAASTLGDQSGDGDEGGNGGQTRSFVPHEQGPLAQPFASDPEGVSGYTVAKVSRTTTLRQAPGGKAKIRIRPKTEWGTPRIMGVVRQRGEWLAVQASELDNGEVGWLRASEAELSAVPWSLHVDLSNRQLTVRKDGYFVRRLSIAVGSPDHPTPQGRFSVTDKLRVADSGSPYGCCVLALSGHQTRLPEGWPGGDRLAVHSTSDLTSIGRPVSLGCMRTETDQAQWLLKKIPLGTPLFVRV